MSLHVVVWKYTWKKQFFTICSATEWLSMDPAALFSLIPQLRNRWHNTGGMMHPLQWLHLAPGDSFLLGGVPGCVTVCATATQLLQQRKAAGYSRYWKQKNGEKRRFFKGKIFEANFLCPRESINCVNRSLGTSGRKTVTVVLYNILKSHCSWDTMQFSQQIRETLKFLRIMLVAG